jgi:S1-C subfamily serine protease
VECRLLIRESPSIMHDDLRTSDLFDGPQPACDTSAAIQESGRPPESDDLPAKHFASPALVSHEPRRRAVSRQPDALTQSLTLLATIAVMLLAARFVVPRVIEEFRYAWHRGELRAEYETGTEGLKNASLEALSEAYQMVTAAVGPSVAHIDVHRGVLAEDASMARLLSGEASPVMDQGSGVVVDGDGYVLTNRHVIADGDEITVTLSDGRRLPASVVGTDALTDLALLKVQADRLLPIVWGDSDRCKVGSPVWAVGSPFGLDRTVTFGILSGKHRMVRASTQYQDFMQSDVAVNPGNSGGPLVDARGTLVGINTAIVGDTYRGVSFSIPSNVARQVYMHLRDSGKVERGWLGVKLDDVAYDPRSGGDPLVRGARVGYLTNHDSPAAAAGLKTGDLILSVNDQPVQDLAHLMRMVGESLAGSRIKLRIVRDFEPLEVQVTLGARPDELSGR